MRFGVVGSGFMGGVHRSAIERIPGASLVAVASRTRPEADGPVRGNLQHVKTAALGADVRWYGDWREMLLDPEVEAVDICLPTYLHKEVALRAFALGKHVLCEKPMALNGADCDAMMRAAETSGRSFMVAQVLRFLFPYRYAASFVDEVCGGAVKACTMRRSTGYPQWSEWLSREELSGGAVLDLLSHDIDQALTLFGAPVAVRAVSRGEIDTMRGTLMYTSGLEVEIVGGWLAAKEPFSAGFTIAGDGATLTLRDGRLEIDRDGVREAVAVPKQDEYLDQIAYFVECCERGMAPVRCLPAESAEAVRIANLLRESRSQNGREVSCGR